LQYLTLDEAKSAHVLDVEEVSASGSVPELRVRNRAKLPVFVPDGTTLIGSKQNRVVNLSIMLAAESETVIPVSCVERGRWSFATLGSSPSECSDSALRAMMSFRSTDSLKKRSTVQVDQSAVWGHVDRMLYDSGASSPTHS
jgi:hypothetical protein